jgi:hypothetical protein
MPFVDHRRHAAALTLDEATEGSSFLLLGVPSPPLLARLWSLRSASGYVPPLDVIEPDAGALDIWLHLLAADGPLLDDPRLGVFAGPEALEQYAAHRAACHWRSEPTHTLTNHRPGRSPPVVDPAFLARVRGEVDARRGLLLSEQGQRCAANDAPARIADHLAGRPLDPPLRVLALTTRFSTVIRHAMRDLAGAFRRHGCTCEIRTEPTDADREIDTWTALAGETYDLVVVINHLRSELGDRIDERLPYACWIQDQMVQLWTPQAGASVGPRDLVIGRDPWSMTRLYGYPAERFLPAVNLTDARTYDAAPVPADDRARFACDVSFVSHGSATVEAIIDDLRREKGTAFAAYLRDIADRMRARLERSGWVPFFDGLRCMDEAERASAHVSLSPNQRRHHVYPVVASLLDRMIRHQALEWAAAWATDRGRTLRIYGRGWERHPTLAAWAQGEIANGHDLRCLYQASAVSLQINGYGSHHQRLLDGLAAGGFVLSRFVPLDFRREPVMHLTAAVECHGLDSLAAIDARAERDPSLREVLASLDELDRCCLRPLPDPRRQEEVRLLRDFYALPAESLTDEAVFESCRDPNLPPRLAGDLPGFAETIFDSADALHRLLDRFVDDDDGRARLSGPLRDDVLAHDTYDVLVPRLLAAFASPEERH